MPATCPKCGQPGWGPSPKWVENKKGPKGKRYFYEVFVHKGPKGRMKPCYVKSTPSSQPDKIERPDNRTLVDQLKRDLHADEHGNYYYKDERIGKSIPKSKVIEIVSDLLGVKDAGLP